LCWAVVFADIGTSVYYTPGILYKQVGALAGFFVFLTLIAFLLLTLKYAEVSARFPEGGGVVTVATHGLNPWAGAVGGMFILVDYFLTSAISSLSGLLYFQAIVPRIAPFVLVITLVVVTLLGVLNWYGIKESAVFSAAIAVAAFVSDIVILALVVINVPLPTIIQVFQAMFSGGKLTAVTLLTGYAGAFLAFSGLESISQLSPVMQLPRKRTVSWALALVVITVGVTSPLLTMFSTVLLTDPRFAHVLVHPAYAINADPNQFISLLGGAFGGRVLEVATAVTASGLLIFASNTAIIGTYHVFLALSRMRFFPGVVERLSALRGTPWVSILLATGIPMAVLVLVQGNVNTLGDLYAFGLLGAFSLTCLSMDVIRYRERHGGPHIGAEIDPELLHANGQGRAAVQASEPGPIQRTLASLVSSLVTLRLSPEAGQRLARMRQQVALARQRMATHLKRPLADVTYYLGFVTTLLVGIAWVTNLFAKPAATIFGGGLTALGVGIAVAHFRYQQRRGEPVVFVDTPVYMPDAWLVVLSPIDGRGKEVIRAAVDSANGRPLAFLYLAPQAPQQAPPRLFEIQNRFDMDKHAQKVLSRAKRAATAAHTPAKYFYAVGGAPQVFDIARKVRPEEIVAEEHTAKRISGEIRAKSGMAVSPEYVRYQVVDGVQIAHNVLHELYAHAATHAPGSPSTPPRPPASRAPTSGPQAHPSGPSNANPPHTPPPSIRNTRIRRRSTIPPGSRAPSQESTPLLGDSTSAGRDPGADNGHDPTLGTPGTSGAPAEQPQQ
jgi:amino acid transporter